MVFYNLKNNKFYQLSNEYDLHIRDLRIANNRLNKRDKLIDNNCRNKVSTFIKNLQTFLNKDLTFNEDCFDVNNYPKEKYLHLTSIRSNNLNSLERIIILAYSKKKKHVTIFKGYKDLFGETHLSDYEKLYKFVYNIGTYCQLCHDPWTIEEYKRGILDVPIVEFRNGIYSYRDNFIRENTFLNVKLDNKFGLISKKVENYESISKDIYGFKRPNIIKNYKMKGFGCNFCSEDIEVKGLVIRKPKFFKEAFNQTFI
jgi:hypothetical protein